MAHIQTGPGQSFSIPLAPPSPSVASPSLSAATVVDSPHPYTSSSYRRASQGPNAFQTPASPTWDIERYDKQSALFESLNRSATVVFWYKPNVEPLRLHQEIPTFPLFSFSSLTEIVEQLGLSERTYLDWFNPRTGAWEQQQVSVVRRIESEQRILYRVRRGLFEALRDDECPGIEAEVKLQEEEQSTRVEVAVSTPSRKRPADQLLEPPAGKHPRSVSMQSFAPSYTVESPPSHAGPSSPPAASLPSIALNVSPLSSDIGAASLPVAQPGSLAGAFGTPQRPHTAVDAGPSQYPAGYGQTFTQDTQRSASTSNASTSNASTSNASTSNASTSQLPALPAAPHPIPSQTPSSLASAISLPLAALPQPHALPRKWPNDFFVYEVAAGLRDMERLAGAEPALKQAEVFRRAFGLAYVKSTFCRHRRLWVSAGEEVQRDFEVLGRDPKACWGEFARHVEGREGAGRRASAAGRRGMGGQGEGGQESMMNVIGMPLPMIMAAASPQGMHDGSGVATGSSVQRASGATTGRAQLPQDEEPVMGSLRPPEEQQHAHQGRR